MKNLEEMLKMLYERLAELQDGRIKIANPSFAQQERIELALLYDILGEDVPEEYWKQVEKEIEEWYEEGNGYVVTESEI